MLVHRCMFACFTGEFCEVSLTRKYDVITCPSDICQLPSSCLPLIKGGFRCDGCHDDESFDKFCRLQTRNFKEGSYMTFSSIKARNQFSIKMRYCVMEMCFLFITF